MTIFLQNNQSHILVQQADTSNVIDHFPAYVYRLELNQKGELMFIKDREKFKIPKEIYGEIPQWVEIVLKDYETVENSLGAMMVGDKGSGKSLMAEIISNKLIQTGLPIIYVDTFIPPEILKLAVRLASPCVVYFDEFEKNFKETPDYTPGSTVIETDKETVQSSMLSFFSDTSLKKTLFLFAINDLNRVCDKLKGRPQRIKYLFQFDQENHATIDDIAQKRALTPFQKQFLKKQSLSIDSVLELTKRISHVKHLHEYNTAIKHLNLGRYFVFDVNIRNIRKTTSEIQVEVSNIGFNMDYSTLTQAHLMLQEKNEPLRTIHLDFKDELEEHELHAIENNRVFFLLVEDLTFECMGTIRPMFGTNTSRRSLINVEYHGCIAEASKNEEVNDGHPSTPNSNLASVATLNRNPALWHQAIPRRQW